MTRPAPVKVLVTGVSGLIAGAVYNRLNGLETCDAYALDRYRAPSERVAPDRNLHVPGNRLFLADLTDFDAVCRAVEGMDAVVHLAADPDPGASWDSLLCNNIVATYHVFEACRRAGVKRVVYASSGQAVLGYLRDEPYRALGEGRYADVPEPIVPVRHDWPVRPINPYGCSKVWGEALARTYADVHGLSCICLRIGWVVAEDRPPEPHGRAAWCSQRDVVQLVERCLFAPETLRFDIFFAMSDNRYRWVDIDHARDVVGYVPQDRAEDHLR